MSLSTLSRLPKHIREFLTVYERSSSPNFNVKNIVVRKYLNNQSQHKYEFRQNNILNGIKLTASDFTPIHKILLQPLFEKYKYDELESYSVDELFKPEYRTKSQLNEEPTGEYSSNKKSRILPSKIKLSKQISGFHANIMKSLSAYYDPLDFVPETKFHNNILRWYLRLLSQTPIIMVLKQRKQLLSDESLNQVNIPLTNLRYAINKLRNELGGDQGSRTYHLTELTDIDIFQLAVKSQPKFGVEELNSSTLHTNVDWSQLRSIEDSLCDRLFQEKNIEITKDNQPYKEAEIIKDNQLYKEAEITKDNKPYKTKDNQPYMGTEIFEGRFKLGSLLKELESCSIKDIFPYDLTYNDYYILTIENDILHNNHDKLIEAIKQFPDVELMALRLDLTSPLITNALETKATKWNEKSSDNLALEIREIIGTDSIESDGTIRQRHPRFSLTKDTFNYESDTIVHHESSIDTLLEQCEKLGLDHVNRSCNDNCIYLLKH